MERYRPAGMPLDEKEAEIWRQSQAGHVSIGSETPATPTIHNHERKDYGHIPYGKEEIASLQNIISSNDSAHCPSDLFDDAIAHTRNNKAATVDLYYEYDGNWGQMRRDHRCPDHRTLQDYWKDSKFRACIYALDDMFTLEAESIIKNLARNSMDERVQLEASTRWLRAKKPEEWNPAVQKQIVANKGSLTQTFFKQLVSQEEFKKTLLEDPFSPVLAQKISEKIEALPLPEMIEEVIVKNMPSDPFSLTDDDDGDENEDSLLQDI